MAEALTAFFSYTAIGLVASFQDLSAGNPSSRAWDFGDTGTSTDVNPTHTFTEEGFHTVTLTLTQGVAPNQITSVSTQRVGVSNSGVECPQMPTYDAVMMRIPATVVSAVNPPLVYSLIRKWQRIIASLVSPEILPQYVHNELYWPLLANDLVIELVSIDIFETRVKGFLMNAANPGSGQGSLKKVVTGPSEAEWNNPTDTLKDISKPGGLMDQYRSQACLLASMLKVTLLICPDLNKPVFPVGIAKPSSEPVSYGLIPDGTPDNKYYDGTNQ